MTKVKKWTLFDFNQKIGKISIGCNRIKDVYCRRMQVKTDHWLFMAKLHWNGTIGRSLLPLSSPHPSPQLTHCGTNHPGPFTLWVEEETQAGLGQVAPSGESIPALFALAEMASWLWGSRDYKPPCPWGFAEYLGRLSLESQTWRSCPLSKATKWIKINKPRAAAVSWFSKVLFQKAVCRGGCTPAPPHTASWPFRYGDSSRLTACCLHQGRSSGKEEDTTDQLGRGDCSGSAGAGGGRVRQLGWGDGGQLS